MRDLPMLADTGFPLTLKHVQTAPVPDLLAGLKTWLTRENPVCTRHPHGFFIVLIDRTDSEDWRLHIWPKGTRRIVGIPAFVHTHDRHVESRILQGQLTNINYGMREVKDGGKPLYNVDYSGDRYASSTSNFLRKTSSRVKPTVQLRKTIDYGGMYRVKHHTYHEVVVSETLTTVTLVCMHSHAPGPVKVVGLDGYPETISFTRMEHPVQEFIKLIKA